MSNQPKLSAIQIKPEGLRAREYAKFRKPRYDEVVVAMDNEGSAFHPPSKNIAASGETEVIAAPGADKCIRIKLMMVNNVGADQRVVSFKEGASGTVKYLNSMPQYGSMWNLNLIGAYWILPPNTALIGNLDAGGNANIQPAYDIVKGIPVNALTDEMSISESLVTTWVDNS